MATKRTQRAASEPAEAKTKRGPTLRPTDTEGVFLNEFNMPCDARGVALSFQALKRIDRDKLQEVDDDAVDGSPARFLKAVSLDPRMPMAVRIDAAKAAAPYFDRKMPLALDGGTDPEAKPLVALQGAIDKLNVTELQTLLSLLNKAGIAV